MSGDAGDFARQALRLAIVKVLKDRREKYTDIESGALEGMVAFTEGYIEALLQRTKILTEMAGEMVLVPVYVAGVEDGGGGVWRREV
jgi:hypothetical protein